MFGATDGSIVEIMWEAEVLKSLDTAGASRLLHAGVCGRVQVVGEGRSSV